MGRLDRKDIGILKKLQSDGRLSNSKIAADLSISEAASWRRIKSLEQDGYIKGYQANLDRRKLGFSVIAFVQLTYVEHDTETTEHFERVIRDSEQVLFCHNTTGDADFLLQVVAKDLDEYSSFVEQVLRKLKGVSAIKSSLSLREVTSATRLPLR
ncbi:Lrp/AsnC family transcriptional regulator [Aestuariibacter sp. AA17]|uniref:Lrp/AsnC family transcriptional regulator n=1 Tax=Fluctibacter corallii TaxID=2984329 RepID=A0ABT3ACC1_9ALTE|nr:Lrp/AsnC family transcriptional regulator [Aestuariibacter sp. AA17]MCV2886319.1 Lrp/AsnC family transcriptional regulator [Aestuariibacter sp. AA17]